MVERLSEGIPFARADFYEVAGELYFGEMTFYPGSSMEEFDPEHWDAELGSWIELPESVGGGWLLVSGTVALWLRSAEPVKLQVQGMVDYKFYCFDGEPRFLYVSQGLDNHETARISFLSMDWEFELFRRDDYAPFEDLPAKPSCFNEMVECARELSVGMPFVRTDFYDYGGKARFSEMTFYPCAGYMPFDPSEWDEKLGGMIDLSNIGKRRLG